jgi:hypothetical protein
MAKARKNGRSERRDRFVAVPHYMMDTAAWRQLSVTARAAWLEFGRVHNGSNNGRLAMSSRLLGKRLGVCKTVAAIATKELVTLGFLDIARASSFSGKRRATEYRLTHLKDDITEAPPSRTFQNIGKTQTPDNGNGLDKETCQAIACLVRPRGQHRPSTRTSLVRLRGHENRYSPSTRTVSQLSLSPIVRPRGHI